MYLFRLTGQGEEPEHLRTNRGRVRVTWRRAKRAAASPEACSLQPSYETLRMVGARELALIKPGSALVNVSRGPIFDPDATIERLSRGDISGAFDVWDLEPIPADSPIRNLPNVVLTPPHLESDKGRPRPLLHPDARRTRPLLPRPPNTLQSIDPDVGESIWSVRRGRASVYRRSRPGLSASAPGIQQEFAVLDIFDPIHQQNGHRGPPNRRNGHDFFPVF